MTEFYAYFCWATIWCAAWNNGLLRFVSSHQIRYLILAFVVLLGFLPLIQLHSVYFYLYGFFDLPSFIFVALLANGLFVKEDHVTKTAWHVFGLCSWFIIITFLLGQTWFYEFGYAPWSTLLLAGPLIYFVLKASWYWSVVCFLILASFSMNIYGSNNVLTYLVCTPLALTYAIRLIIQFYTVYRGRLNIKGV